ncbi:MAG: flagellar hook-basal body protein [Lachnospiraceae bacterium]|nr:flagellar hook-basal body protein [Lachnospiraceae bacterium]
MRVTNSTLYRKYTTSVNNVHSQLNKSMNKVSSGAAYEAAADNPLAYYSGKRMDTEYQDVLSKKELLGDIQKRLYQQELGARSLQQLLDTGESNVRSQISYILNTTNNEIPTTVSTVRDDLIQKQQSMVNSLNGKYENFYVYGGNDLSTTPFSLTYDTDTNEMTFKYTHKFSGDSTATEFEFKLQEQNGSYTFALTSGNGDKLMEAMSEQGRVDIGYGSIHDSNTLMDTYTGGINLLTGFTSDAVRKGQVTQADVEKALADSAIGLTGQSIVTMNKYINYLDSGTVGSDSINKDEFSQKLGVALDKIERTSNKLGAVYSDLGNKYNLLETTADRLTDQKISLEDQYREKMGADPYEAIMEMFSYQQSYMASLRVSSSIMGTSLFDFMR